MKCYWHPRQMTVALGANDGCTFALLQLELEKVKRGEDAEKGQPSPTNDLPEGDSEEGEAMKAVSVFFCLEGEVDE